MESQEDKQSQEQEVHFAGSGNPFKTEKAALSAIKQKGLDPDKCEIVPQKNEKDAIIGYGYVAIAEKETTTTSPPTTTTSPPPPKSTDQPKGHVMEDETYYDGELVLQTIYKAPGKPFLSPREAKDFMVKNHINPGTNRIIKVDEHAFAIYGDGQKMPVVEKEKYYRVSFQAKAQPNDPEDVMLSVNGETLVIQREKEVIIPARFRECADHALIIQFKQLPDQPRKIEAPVRTYPYTLHGESTEAEYFKQKGEGDRKSKQNVKRYGFDVTPEMVSE